MTTSAAVPKDAPVMIAWTGFQKTEEFENSQRWLAYPQHRLGSMWALFYAGFYAAAMQAAEAAAEGQPAPWKPEREAVRKIVETSVVDTMNMDWEEAVCIATDSILALPSALVVEGGEA